MLLSIAGVDYTTHELPDFRKFFFKYKNGEGVCPLRCLIGTYSFYKLKEFLDLLVPVVLMEHF